MRWRQRWHGFDLGVWHWIMCVALDHVQKITDSCNARHIPYCFFSQARPNTAGYIRSHFSERLHQNRTAHAFSHEVSQLMIQHYTVSVPKASPGIHRAAFQVHLRLHLRLLRWCTTQQQRWSSSNAGACGCTRQSTAQSRRAISVRLGSDFGYQYAMYFSKHGLCTSMELVNSVLVQLTHNSGAAAPASQ